MEIPSPPHPEDVPPSADSGIGTASGAGFASGVGTSSKFTAEPGDVAAPGIIYHLGGNSEIPTPQNAVGRFLRTLQRRMYLHIGLGFTLCCLGLFYAGFVVYQWIYIVPITPDYSSLDVESDSYWNDRTLIDIDTARQASRTEHIRIDHLRIFTNRTAEEAALISNPYLRAQAVTRVARTLAENDINITLDNFVHRLGNTPMIVSMRARTLVSQALMHLRHERNPSALTAFRQYNRLVREADLKLNSPLNEESFFGAVTVLKYLNNTEELKELFERQKTGAAVLGLDQRMRAYRLIAGEQARAGMTLDALETAKSITNNVEQSRAWTLILQCSARPAIVVPEETHMLTLNISPPEEPLHYPAFPHRVLQEILEYLLENKDLNAQSALLRRIAGSPLMCDSAIYPMFRQSIAEDTRLHDRVKQSVLQLLDDPESPTIRTALKMPPRTEPIAVQADSAMEDWTSLDDAVYVEVIDIDPTPLRTRTDLQRLQAQIAIAQAYQSIRRFQDADRILKQVSAAAQRLVAPQVRRQLQLQIAERQIAIGSTADAQATFLLLAPELPLHQKSDLARLQLLARLYNAAYQTIANIDPPAQREITGSFLLREQLRINRINDAERTLTLMPPGRIATESRSRLNIAKGTATGEDYSTLGIPTPESNPDWKQHCIRLIQQGLLWTAYQAADRIADDQQRTDVLVRIAHEYLLLYQAFDDTNDPNRTYRQEILQAIESTANRTGQPVVQTEILVELLMYHTGRLRTEADRTDGKRLWQQAMETCRTIVDRDNKSILFAQLIIAKNNLDNPNFARRTFPLFTRATNAPAFDESIRLINECLALINTQEDLVKRGFACAHLARAAVQIARTAEARIMLDEILDIVPDISEHEALVSLFLTTVPAWRGMNSMDSVPQMYRMAIDGVAHEFSGSDLNVDEYRWRMRDTNIERIIRSQLENGFVDDAVTSAFRLNEPVLRDRLLQTSIYIYLDHENFAKAEMDARRIQVKEIRDNVLRNIQLLNAPSY